MFYLPTSTPSFLTAVGWRVLFFPQIIKEFTSPSFSISRGRFLQEIFSNFWRRSRSPLPPFLSVPVFRAAWSLEPRLSRLQSPDRACLFSFLGIATSSTPLQILCVFFSNFGKTLFHEKNPDPPFPSPFFRLLQNPGFSPFSWSPLPSF